MEYTETHATTAMIKAMAHPLRRRILAVFPRRDYVRAADLAAEFDEPANKISFHLRVLADAGLLVEAPEHARDRRDRVWAQKRLAVNFGDKEHPLEEPALGGVLFQTMLDEHLAIVRRVASWVPDYLADPVGVGEHGTFSRTRVKLSSEQYTALLAAIQRVIREAQDAASVAPDPDARVVELDIVAADETI